MLWPLSPCYSFQGLAFEMVPSKVWLGLLPHLTQLGKLLTGMPTGQPNLDSSPLILLSLVVLDVCQVDTLKEPHLPTFLLSLPLLFLFPPFLAPPLSSSPLFFLTSSYTPFFIYLILLR